MILRYSLLRHKAGIFKTMTGLTVTLFDELVGARICAGDHGPAGAARAHAGCGGGASLLPERAWRVRG